MMMLPQMMPGLNGMMPGMMGGNDDDDDDDDDDDGRESCGG